MEGAAKDAFKTLIDGDINNFVATDLPGAIEVLIKPIDDLILVIDQMSKTLDDIKDTPYYQGVFDKYEQLMQNIKFN